MGGLIYSPYMYICKWSFEKIQHSKIFVRARIGERLMVLGLDHKMMNSLSNIELDSM